jgi:hypothetical protein
VSISRCRWCDDSHSPAASVNELKNMTVVILAGGLGTRLRSVVGDRPKVLAPVQVDDRFERFAPESIDLRVIHQRHYQNVIRAVKMASKRGMRTIALTGSGGLLSGMVDVSISVPSMDTQRIQETHLAVEHILCELVEAILFRGDAVEVDPQV